MCWITREHIKVGPGRLSVVDPQVHRSECRVLISSKRYRLVAVSDGTVFDVPDCELGHNDEDVSFDSFLNKYGLADPALKLLADIVRAADSSPSNPHPAGEGYGG